MLGLRRMLGLEHKLVCMLGQLGMLGRHTGVQRARQRWLRGQWRSETECMNCYNKRYLNPNKSYTGITVSRQQLKWNCFLFDSFFFILFFKIIIIFNQNAQNNNLIRVGPYYNMPFSLSQHLKVLLYYWNNFQFIIGGTKSVSEK